MENKPNYFSILPAVVRYDSEITDFSKVLFAEITALSNKNGYCNASNSTIAKNFGKSKTTISTALSLLDEKGYIKVEIERNSSGTFRKIFPLVDVYSQKLKGGIKKIERGVSENNKGGIKKTERQKNNTSNNNTSNNKRESTRTKTPKTSAMWTKLDTNLHNYKIPFSDTLNESLVNYWKYMEERNGHNWGTKTTIVAQVDKVKAFLNNFSESQIIDSLEECQERGNVTYNPQWTINRRKKQNEENKSQNTYSFKTQISNA